MIETFIQKSDGPQHQHRVNNMYKRIAIVLFYIITITIAVYTAYMKGRNDVWLSEYEVAKSNILLATQFYTNECSPDLRDFLKCRYYYLANKIPAGSLDGVYDYGSISTNIDYLNVGIEMTSAQREYRLFQQKQLNSTRQP